MAYSKTNPPSLLMDRIGGGGAVWSYISPDNRGAVTTAGYFTNAQSLGMRVGDVVNAVVAASGVLTVATVTSINAAGAGTITALAV